MKTIFVAFPIEDERIRDLIKGQSLNTRTTFQYIDMSVKEAYEYNWKDKVAARIRRSNGVLATISRNSLSSVGQKWELKCAVEERKPITGVWAYKNDRTVLPNVKTIEWTWQGIASFIDSL